MSLPLALVAALGFGTFFVGLDAAADASVLWALLVARATTTALTAGGVLALGLDVSFRRGDLPALCGIGVFDMSANALFALAAVEGLLSVAAVLGSMYPVATALLAFALLGERLGRAQAAGVGLALAGVVLIAGG